MALIPNSSGKMGIREMQNWYREIVLKVVENGKSVVLWDSCATHNDQKHFSNIPKPNNKHIKFMNIPEGTTAYIQPWGSLKNIKLCTFLDVYGFRIIKAMERKISDQLLYEEVFTGKTNDNIFSRNNLLKMISLLFNQVASPRFQQMFVYGWYASGYVEVHPGRFDNPNDFCFAFDLSLPCSYATGCNKSGFFRCGWCKKVLCATHLFVDPNNRVTYHFCTQYIE